MNFINQVGSVTAVVVMLVGATSLFAQDSDTVVLDETGVKNLRIETAMVEETDFEESFFALGHIEAVPEKTAGVSSRIAGRIVELSAHPGDRVKKGDVVAKVESRLPGDPPPVIPLVAPIGGLVTHANARLGDPLSPDTALLEITDLSEVYAVAKVPEYFAARIKPGTQAHIKVVALPDEKFDGKLVRFGTTADEESGTIDAIFILPNESGRLREEMRAEFSVVLDSRPNVLSVPRSALQGEASNRFVYVKHFDLPNAFVKTPVQTGKLNDSFAEIEGGLFPGDDVVTKGGYSLSFAGASSISLKDALDAAHGHEHAEDGSELSPEKEAELAAQKRAEAGLPAEGAGESPMWKIVSGVLFVLLLASLLIRKGPVSPDEVEHSKSNPETP